MQRLRGLRPQADLGEHPRLEPSLRIAQLEEDAQRPALLGERGRKAAHAPGNFTSGKA